MTFGKLGGDPIEFLSKPYEECLYGIAVTHMPRYLINMHIKPGETIFDKIGIPYDELRQMDNPIAPVAKYYRSQLKPGESLWWTGDSSDEAVSATIRLWKNLTADEKRRYIVYGLVNYPEVFGGDYDRYALWLTSQGVVDSHIRDQFSAGGQEEMLLSSGKKVKFPGIYRRVKNNMEYLLHLMSLKNSTSIAMCEKLDANDFRRRILDWCDVVSRRSTMDYDISMEALKVMFQRRVNLYDEDIRREMVPEDRTITCGHCGNTYHQRLAKQIEGHRCKEEDICPYCGKSNDSSMRWSFENRK